MVKNKSSYKFIKKIITFFFFVVMFFILFNTNSSYAVTTNAYEGEIKSLIEGIKVRQIGGNEVLLEIRGSKMSLPKVIKNSSFAITLEWPNIKFPVSTDKKDWWNDYGWDIIRVTREQTNNWWQKYDYPLIQRIQIESKNDVDVTLNITGEKPLKIKSIRGMDGSDQLTIRLDVIEEEKNNLEANNSQIQKVTKNVMDPLGMNTKVSLELRDVSAREVFRMLAKLRNLNLVLDSTVPDTPMTISFNQSRFGEVFAYMLRMNDLTYSIMGETLIVGTIDSIGKTLGKNKTKGYKVAFADLSKLPTIIVGLVPLSKPPVIDERTRTLYVTATPEQHVEIEAIMNKVDHPGKQVMLQARLIEVNDNAVQDVQAFLSGVYKGWLFSYGSRGLGLEYLSSNLEKKNILTSSSSSSSNKIPYPGETQTSIPVNAVDSARTHLMRV